MQNKIILFSTVILLSIVTIFATIQLSEAVTSDTIITSATRNGTSFNVIVNETQFITDNENQRPAKYFNRLTNTQGSYHSILIDTNNNKIVERSPSGLSLTHNILENSTTNNLRYFNYTGLTCDHNYYFTIIQWVPDYSSRYSQNVETLSPC